MNRIMVDLDPAPSLAGTVQRRVTHYLD